MRLHLTATNPIKLTPSRYRVLSALYHADHHILSTELSKQTQVVNVSLQVGHLRDAGIHTVSEYTENPNCTAEFYLAPLKRYKLAKASRGLAELSLVAYQERVERLKHGTS